MSEKDRNEAFKEAMESVSNLVTETVKDVQSKAEPVAEKAKVYIDEAIRKAEPKIQEAKKKAEPVTEKAKEYFDDAARKAEPVIDEAKKKAEPVTEKAKEYFDNAARKAEPKIQEARNAFEEQMKKMGLGKPEVYVQYGPYEADMEKVMDRIKAAYAAGGNKAPIKQIKVYVKPEENAVYYVVNADQHFGKITLF